MAFLSRRYGLGLKDVEQQGLLLAGGPSSQLFGLGLLRFPNSATRRPPAAAPSGFGIGALRDWFSDAGIYIGRPAPGFPSPYSLAE